MAKLVKVPKNKEFHFRPSTRGNVSKYNWDEWFDGQTWMLEQSKGEKDSTDTVVVVEEKGDYDIPTAWMPGKLKLAARKKYKVVQVSRFDANGDKLQDAVIIRARDMSEEERAQEDALRAEEEEKKAVKRAEKRAEKAAKNGQEEVA